LNPRNLGVPAILLLLGFSRHYGWWLADPALQGMVAKGTGALMILFMLVFVWSYQKSTMFTLVAVWLAFEESQTAVCSAWYVYEPWTVPQGIGICSAKAGIDFGAIGLIIVSVLASTLLIDKTKV